MAARKKSSAAKRKTPWKRAAPKSAHHTHLTAAQKATAKRAAKKAGRPYPNLVDNMRVATKASATRKKSATTKKSATKRSGTKKTSTTKRKSTGGRRGGTARTSSVRKRSSAAREVTRDPHGGLTAAGRRAFARSEGAHLRPGVTGRDRELSPVEMRRKGSWAVRFYGRAGSLPPLVDAHGKPTRFALTAAAWGEPVPRTVAAARRIAAKGRRLLARYERTKG